MLPAFHQGTLKTTESSINAPLRAVTIRMYHQYMNPIKYDEDIAAWAVEQARLMRARRFELLDIEHLSEEIEDLSKSEKRELLSRFVALLSHLLKWQFQPDDRGNSWTRTIRVQRKHLLKHLDENPSLHPLLTNPQWFEDAWDDAVDQASRETGIDGDMFPSVCEWSVAEILTAGWAPGVTHATGR